LGERPSALDLVNENEDEDAPPDDVDRDLILVSCSLESVEERLDEFMKTR